MAVCQKLMKSMSGYPGVCLKKKIGIIFLMFLLILMILILLSNTGLPSGKPCLEMWEEFSHKPEKVQLINWIHDTAGNILRGNKLFTEPVISIPLPAGCSGLFVTLVRRGKVRGCYGAFSHRYSSLTVILKDYIRGAMFLDPRHKPLERHELDDTEFILTVTSDPEPVNDINNVDISNFGVFIECEDSVKTVIVPAEFRTASGMMKHAGNSRCRFYRFRAVTIK